MANFRTLTNGTSVYELEQPVELVVRTRAPMKWLLVDRETGEMYIGAQPKEGEKHWHKIPESEVHKYLIEKEEKNKNEC